MGIYQKQFEKILSREILKSLLEGQPPNITEISNRLQAITKNKSKILYKYIPQQYKSTFNYKVYNKALNEIKFDLDLYNEELIDLFTVLSRRISFADLYHKVNSSELIKLKSELESLLFTIKDADFYFSGAYDTFSDMTKINQEESTSDIVDLSEQVLSLPYKGRSTKRIDVSEVISLDNIQIKYVGVDTNLILESSQIPGSSFGNIFTDVSSVWGYKIVTSENIPIEFYVDFPIGGSNNTEQEYLVSRFEIIPHITHPTLLKVKVSNDSVNYLDLLGNENGVLLNDQRKIYAMDFETNLVQYVRLYFSKEQADQEVIVDTEKRYEYLFGLKSFAAFTTGRILNGIYQSLPFTFTNLSNLSKVSLEANSSIPEGCSILYSIGTTDSAGNLSDNFTPITPLGTVSNVGASDVVSFNNTVERSLKFVVSSEGDSAPVAYGSPRAGIQLYRIGPALTTDSLFGKNQLFRGYKAWSRSTSGLFNNISVSDIYIPFTSSDVEKIYTVTEEIAQVIPSTVFGSNRTKLELTKIPYFNGSAGHLLKPVNPLINDTTPNYAIYKVELIGLKARNTVTITIPANSNASIDLPVSYFIVQSNNANDLPIIRASTGTTYRNGIDYSFEVENINGIDKPTGKLNILDNSPMLSGGNFSFTYTTDSDITHKVDGLTNKLVELKDIFLSTLATVKVTYRYIPTDPNKIIGNSIQISNLPSTSSNRIYYTEGVDYLIDEVSGSINRMPNGSIPVDGSVYASFVFMDAAANLETFTTWAYLPTGIQIKFDTDTSGSNLLEFDEELGEAFYVNTVQGLVALTKSNSTPVLPSGWVQFVVRSKNPDIHLEFRSNLIDQVIQLRDNFKQKIFREKNRYFSDILALREPLKERTVNHLKVNTLATDRTVFAIDSITDPTNAYIVLNFIPNTEQSLYCKQPTADADNTSAPELFDEQFRLDWTTLSQENDIGGIVVRIELNRVPTVDGALTPKVLDYKIRVG